MSRPADHLASHPFRLSRSAVEAHRRHMPTPFVGCPLCIRRGSLTPLRIRWTSPRLG